jgi:hypothetical protein
LTTGGPGDAMQNPDSESCYALIESYATLYQVTGDKKWLTYAEETTKQFISWVMAYNYKFPEKSTFGKLGISSVGAVFANTQNKHGAPGVCTFSGLALLRLYRATGDKQYLTLLQEMAHGATQFVAHSKRPIGDLPFGWMSERVSTTDWLEGIGEIVRHTTWAETTLMLTYTEIPGLYVQPQSAFFVPIDHLTVVVKKNEKSKLTLTLTNPTTFDAVYSILVESPEAQAKQLGVNPGKSYEMITIPAGKSIDKVFKKN